MGPTRRSSSHKPEENQDVIVVAQDSVTTTSKSNGTPLRIDTEATEVVDTTATTTTPPQLNSDLRTTPGNPLKKRRLDGPPSPPWKLPTAETPSSFIDPTGRKRSARTNTLPDPATPADTTRKTRSAIAKSEDKNAGSSNVNNLNLHKKPISNSSKAKRNSTSKYKIIATSSATRQSNRSVNRPTYGSQHTIRNNGRTQDKTPSKPSTTSSQKDSASTRRSQRRRTNTHQRGQASNEAGYGDEEDLDVQSDDCSGPESDPEDPKGPRISVRLTFSRKVKPPVLCNINNIPLPRKYPSLRAFLEADVPTPEEDAALDEIAVAEAMKRFSIEQAYEEGILRPEHINTAQVSHHAGPERAILRRYSHADHLIAHAIRFNKLLKMERTAHIRIAKNTAHLAAEAAIRRLPKTAEEIEQERRQQSKARYLEVLSDLKARLQLAEKAAQDILRKRFIEVKRAQQQENMRKMLNHSSTLLGARIKGRCSNEEDLLQEGSPRSVEEADDEDEDEEDEDEDMFDDESNMSESEESEENFGADIVDGDDDLSPEELRKKYAGMEEASSDQPAPDLEDMSMQDVDERRSESDVRTDVDDGEQLESVVRANDSDEDILMDSEDDELSATSDGNSVEAESYEEEDDDYGESDSGEEGDGLWGFFSKDERKNVQQHDANGSHGYSTSSILDEEGMEEDEEDLSEVEMVPVNDRDSSPKPPDVDADISQDYKEDPTDLAAEQQLRADGQAYSENDTLRSVDGVVMENVEPRNSHSTTSENSSMQKLGLSGASTVTTPTSAGLLPEAKEEAKTPIPSLLRGTLREYQHHGLDWLSGLYDNGTNGILADEMGLGKTIQTIALISHLATAKGVWGPHLIVVPTSVILNWEMEFKKWAPGFKIMTYYGNQDVRKEKRKGWMNDDRWNVCITSYQIVVQDQATFKRRNWHYLILDEAHNIKNFRSQRWQTLLNFKAGARLLITGTPLQNNLIELWSLLYFLMPSGGGVSSAMPAGFTDLREFQEWFSHPVDQLIEGGREGMDDEAKDSIRKLHAILRPFLLRRLKKDVEKQMPGKYEHIVWCHLSKRQRFLYDEFMSRAQTKETLTSGNYLSIINCLMQLRKVCNHPDLFETRQIVTSFAMRKAVIADYEIQELFVRQRLFKAGAFDKVDLGLLNLNLAQKEASSAMIAEHTSQLAATHLIRAEIAKREQGLDRNMKPDYDTITGMNAYVQNSLQIEQVEQLKQMAYLNEFRTRQRPLYGTEVHQICESAKHYIMRSRPRTTRSQYMDWLWQNSNSLKEMLPTVKDRANSLDATIQKFGCVTPAVVATDMPRISITSSGVELSKRVLASSKDDPFHRAQNRLSIAFPDKRLLQYDCGKLQKLDELLRNLQAGGHRALIFTQMTKVLDILEQFLNIHGHKYLRLDGATKIEQRQILTERFNSDPRILVFILSTRSGGLGINLTGADSVIFYDLDWNPAMDKQCQDRCHRIGQTRDVHIYRFVSEFTIESNILRKSNQKQMLDDIVIQEGEFTVDKFNRLTVADLFGDDAKKLGLDFVGGNLIGGAGNLEEALEGAEDADDVAAAKIAEKEDVEELDREDFAQNVPREPVKTLAAQETATPTPTETMENTPGTATPAVVAEDQDEVDEDEEERPSTDEYLVRLWIELLKDEPVVMPKKSKRDRNGKVRRPR